MVAPVREGAPLLGGQAVGDLDVKVLHRGARAVLDLGLSRLGGDEPVAVERLGNESLDGLLAGGAHLAAERPDVVALVAGQLLELLLALGRKRTWHSRPGWG